MFQTVQRKNRTYLYNSTNYKFEDGTTQAINVPYPDSGVYANYILHYPDATNVELLAINIDQLDSEVETAYTDAKIARGYEYIYEERDPGNGATNVLITVGIDDFYVNDGSSTYYLHRLQLKYGFRSLVVSIGPNWSGLKALAESEDWYFKATDSNGEWVAEQISRIISSTVPVPAPTTSLPACASPFAGKIAVVFELNAVNAQIQDVVTFVSTNLYNSPNYDFTTSTHAINVPYGNTDFYASMILQFTFAKSLDDLQSNIDLMNNNALPDTTSNVSDGLFFLFHDRPPGVSKNVLIVVGNQNDYDSDTTQMFLEQLRNDQGYKVLSVSIGANAGDLSSIADKPEWYFEVGNSNGQSVADQIARIISCSNQQVVFRGQLGVIFELLPSTSSTQQDTINAFVENILLNSNFYGLAVDNLTGANRTLVTSIPYPSTSQYNVQGFGSARSVSEFKSQVDAFNGVIKPVTATSDISDALLYVAFNLSAPGNTPSALIIVGSSKAMLDNGASPLADDLKIFYSIYTISIGDVDLSPLSSGAGFSFTDTSQQTANQIAQSLEASNPVVYCPPPVPSSTTTVTTATPTGSTTLPACASPFAGKIAVVFELNAVNAPIQDVVTFVSTNLYNSSNYDFTTTTHAINVPYGNTDFYASMILQFTFAKSLNALQTNIDLLYDNALLDTTATVSDGLKFLFTSSSPPGASNNVLIVVGNQNDDNSGLTEVWLEQLRNDQGYKVLSVSIGANAGDLSSIADKPEWYFQVGDSNGQSVADQIARIISCSNQQVVFRGQLGVIFELLPSTSSTQQDTINAFVENILLNSNFYGLAPDALTGENRTLVTAIPYPSTFQYNVQGYGSARSIVEFKNQVDTFNENIQPVTVTSDLTSALLFVATQLPSGTTPSALVIVGNSKAMLDQSALDLSEDLKKSFKIFTVSLGYNAVDLSPLSSGAGYYFNGYSQQIADQIAQICASPYQGKIAVVFELNKNEADQSVVNFVRNNLYNSTNYNFETDTEAISVPYPGTDTTYGDKILFFDDNAKSLADLQTNIDNLQALVTDNATPEISDGLSWLFSDRNTEKTKAVLIVVGNQADDNSGTTTMWLLYLRSTQGYQVLSVSVGANAGDLSSIADKPEWYFQVGDSNGQSVADQISFILCNL
ncbi:unnamed protein product [Caenorhabditis sp. 36 PRJEB53466]|nr:unnamed protein product [Caenorhabditis sp. 36 PRJEB53466]